VNEKYYIQKNNSSTQNNVFIKCFSNTKRFTVLSLIAFLTCFQTCYLFLGPLPDPAVLAVGEALKGLRPQPLISSVLNDFSELSLVDSRFGPVPRGSVLSYQCPPLMTKNKVKHPDAPLFPKLPIDGAAFPRSLYFVPSCHQFFHLESVSVSMELAAVIEEQTQDQSECPLWKEMRKPRVTASRFHEASHVRGETSGQALARRILKGTKQTQAMKTGLDKEPEVLERYSDLFNVNVSPCDTPGCSLPWCQS